MRSPDVYKALDPPENCMNRASRPYRHMMKPHPLWSQLSIPETPLFHQRQPLSWFTSDFSARAPKVASGLIIWESGVPPGFAELWASRSSCCVNKDTSRVCPLFRGAVHHIPR